MHDRPPTGPSPPGDRWTPALVTAAGRLLPGAAPLDPGDDLGDLAGAATTHHLTGPVLAALALDHVALPADRVEALRGAHLGAMRWCVQLEARLVEVRRWFDEAGGVDVRVLKGPAVAHLDEPDPTLRSFADLDLLIAPHHLDRAVAALHRHGAVRRIPERRPGFDARFAKGVGTACADGVEIDVHRTLVGRAHGFRIPLGDLFADPEPFEVGGHRFLALSRPHRALHAAYHAVAGSPAPPLRTVRDLGGYLTAPGLGPEVLAPIAERWGGTAVLAEAAALTLATFGPEPGADDDVAWSRWRTWLDSVEIDPAETILLARGRRPVPWPVEWTTLRELGWADRARFCWAVAVPADEDLRSGLVRRRTRSARALLRSRPWARPVR
jgi:hypothetical protein